MELAKGEQVSQLVASGNRFSGWVVTFQVNGRTLFLRASGKNHLRLIKTELALFKLIKKVGCSAILTDLEFTMETTATKMAAIFAVAQLNLSKSSLSTFSDEVPSLYTGAIRDKCGIEVSNNQLIGAVKEYIVDPALFTSNLNALCMSCEPEEVKPLSLLWTHLYNLGNIHKEFQSQVESVLSNLNSEHLQ